MLWFHFTFGNSFFNLFRKISIIVTIHPKIRLCFIIFFTGAIFRYFFWILLARKTNSHLLDKLPGSISRLSKRHAFSESSFLLFNFLSFHFSSFGIILINIWSQQIIKRITLIFKFSKNHSFLLLLSILSTVLG